MKTNTKTNTNINFHSSLQDMSQNELDDHFTSCCGSGDIKQVSYILENLDLSSRYVLSRSLLHASAKDKLNIVKYLLKASELKDQPDFSNTLNSAIILASQCSGSQNKALKYLISTQDLTSIFDSTYFSYWLKSASSGGSVSSMKYLLTCKKLSPIADIQFESNTALKSAVVFGHLECVRYLLQSPDLKTHAEAHTQKEWILSTAMFKNHTDIIKYLILDYKITKTPEIIRLINQHLPSSSYIQDLFSKQEAIEEKKSLYGLIDSVKEKDLRKVHKV